MANKPKRDCEAIPTWYYTQDMWGVPDGKKNLRSVKCGCCGKRLDCTEVEAVDCGTAYFYECPSGCCNFSWYDLIPEC